MILIALGANLPSSFGTPEETLRAAIGALQRSGVDIVAASRVWVTEPVPKSEQPFFRNSVVKVSTAMSARDLLDLLHEIEARFGRVRSVPNAPRLLDLDLIAYEDIVAGYEQDGGSGMVVPHPRMHMRSFVLGPLCDIAAEWMHPVYQISASELWRRCPKEGEAYPVEGAVS